MSVTFILLSSILLSCGYFKKKPESSEVKNYDTVKYENKITEIEKDTTSPEMRTDGDLKTELIQYTQVKIKNPFNKNLEIISDGKTLKIIPPQEIRSINIGCDSIIYFKIGDKQQSRNIVKANKKPEINLSRIESSVFDSSLKSIQKSAGYKLEITDDFPSQLDIEIKGPVTFKKVGAAIYYVTLNYLHSQTAFDNFATGKEKPYKVSFKVKVKDKICTGHEIEETGDFIFSKW